MNNSLEHWFHRLYGERALSYIAGEASQTAQKLVIYALQSHALGS